VLPVQCRMARAALGWTTQSLADHAGVGVNTVSRFENGEADAGSASLARMIAALQQAGISLIPENSEGGPGARFARATIQLLRKPSWSPIYDHFAFTVAYRDFKVIVLVTHDILDDLDNFDYFSPGNANGRTREEYEKSMQRNISVILQACERAIDAGNVRHDNRLYLTTTDFAAGLM